ncbi:inositol polyphosphate multikinase [Austrofundulus limnaeus]|uniref:Kinase n=1 Tax=Austrofundulus limnaeus TaxID=52670 RepID=A0A2I4BDU0_AUSLI|nr:PREDICTED: inositol polyphosphate multikinase-like [Austrofundulus limnaeus]
MMKSSVTLEELPPGSDIVLLKDSSGHKAHLNGCVPLSHQVAGHKYGVDKVGILQHPDGTVLKQVQPPPRGPREVQFYNTVFAEDCSDPCLLDLQNHIPKYYGTWSSPDNPNDLYLKLEDVTSRFIRPCIMDVKLGQRSYDPFASQEKREQQIRKYPLMEEIGFLILGMRIYNLQSGTFDSFNQHYGRSLVKDTVKDGLAKFFDNGVFLRKDAIWASIHRVRQILHWFTSQNQLAFYASSLLFVYEGQPSSSSFPSLLRNPSVDDAVMKTAKLLLMSDSGQGQEEEANQEGARAENEGAEHNNNTEEATNYTNQRKTGYHLCGRDYHLNNSVDAQITTTSEPILIPKSDP